MTVDEVNLINLPKILDARGNLSFVYHNFSVIKTSRLGFSCRKNCNNSTG